MQQFSLNTKIRKTRKAFDDVAEKQQKQFSDKQRKRSREEKQQTRYACLTGGDY